ncbi:phosphatidylethanolamine-binding protein [Gamsiella multidivaricata]|uniref:phosphatidylethanolamine-binding protein n=1 Tax=Gamsiella multidivaricata TaxID=101098 RepID=UPI0022207B3F|nr:phosphatidylethanolamine-binding protein [Gamsiella multidivaricata]KAI7824334.1 phosphatidylethanolamine-binding protein [Gamsiella multidivaricata]
MPLITSDQAAESALRKDGIIPDVIPEFHSKTMLIVSYGNGKEIALGNKLSAEETQQSPEVSFQADDPNDKYTLIMTDPDAPSRSNPKNREFRHWIVSNISGSSPTAIQPANLSQGTILTPYMGPAPPKGSGPHRYVFLLFKQSTSNLTLATPLSHDRPGFKSKQFSNETGLELVGANYFFAENP